MKKTISATPLSKLLQLAAEAGKQAALDALRDGREVTSLENGQIVRYGQNRLGSSRSIS